MGNHDNFYNKSNQAIFDQVFVAENTSIEFKNKLITVTFIS